MKLIEELLASPDPAIRGEGAQPDPRRLREATCPARTALHYPLYYHHDILGGLGGMRDLGVLGDPRCADATDLLASMRVDGGCPAHTAYCRAADRTGWGGTGARRANPWVTADALAILRPAGRVDF